MSDARPIRAGGPLRVGSWIDIEAGSSARRCSSDRSSCDTSTAMRALDSSTLLTCCESALPDSLFGGVISMEPGLLFGGESVTTAPSRGEMLMTGGCPSRHVTGGCVCWIGASDCSIPSGGRTWRAFMADLRRPLPTPTDVLAKLSADSALTLDQPQRPPNRVSPQPARPSRPALSANPAGAE